jgi:hypothetical protein
VLQSVIALEKQRRPTEPEPVVEKACRQPAKVDEDTEIYYMGNRRYPNDLEAGYVCNLSFFQYSHDPAALSSVAQFLLHEFGGGTFRIARVRNGFVVNERIIDLPGPTKDLELTANREVARGPDW